MSLCNSVEHVLGQVSLHAYHKFVRILCLPKWPLWPTVAACDISVIKQGTYHT